ncbi:hypothetical protein ACNO8X_20660 [Mycobacterium sp. PDNC021]|uniref:hypothetical protein n=1 Tax=Mycobacterium sp. PDNC021 TaxID=3391399 RepID=UPI003AAD1CD6
MVNARSRCAARLNVAGAVGSAGVVVLSFVGVSPPGHGAAVDVSAVRLAAASAPLSAQWAALDQFITTAAQLGARVAVVPASGPSVGGQPGKPMPLAATSTAPIGPAPLAAAPTPLAGIPIISDIGSAISSAFWSFVGPLVNNAVVGPFVLFGAIFFGIFVVAPIMYVVQTVQQFFAPLLGLLPVAAGPAAAKTDAPTAAVPGPTAIAADAAPAGPDVVNAPIKAPRGFTPKNQKPAASTFTVAAAVDGAAVDGAGVDGAGVGGTDIGKAKGRPAPNQLNAPDVQVGGGGKTGTGKSDPGKSAPGKSLSHSKKSSHDGSSGNSGRPGKGNKGGS